MASLSKEDYQIGIMCALHIESAAMTAMLDEEHNPLPTDIADTNQYQLGRIGEHNVIIACLPAGLIGTTSAATVATNMKRSFPIKVGLMVGIGGGVWSTYNDIRLGDIVVSQPTNTHGGVVQWDFGHENEGSFKRRGHLNSPPLVLLNALQTLKNRYERRGLEISDALSLIKTNAPKMLESDDPAERYTHPGSSNDHLFEALYPHEPNELNCEKCDLKKRAIRKDRKDQYPKIFYGNIASGNSVMKSSQMRDDIAKQEEVICFEMEAAGLMNDFPCLVIRGIADYSDSHKNWMWQRYAAATAAAFARVFLGFVDKQKLTETPKTIGPAHFLNPLGENDKFVGREPQLKQLMDIFYTDHKGNNCQRTALSGLGGVGKTQIANQFTFQLREKSPDCSIFWVRASDEVNFEKSYEAIAEELRISGWEDKQLDVKALVKSKLSDKSAGKWLLVVDNADDRQLFQTTNTALPSLSNYLPSSLLGGLLFTTRDYKAATMLTDNVIPIDKMEHSESLELLSATLLQNQSVQDIPSKNALLEHLVNLPLAIAQAVAYMNEQQITISEYMELYNNSDKDLIKLLSHPFKAGRRYKDTQDAIVRTWVISFEQVQQQDPLAADYLKFISCIQDHDIPQTILPPNGRQSSDGNSDDDSFERTQALGTLKAYGFLTPQVDRTLYDMHPLVHLVTRNWLQEEKQLSFWEDTAVQRLHHLIPWVYALDKKKTWFQFYPHAVFITASPEGFTKEENKKIDMLDKVGNCQNILGHYNTAYRTHTQVCKWRVNFLGNEHRDTLVSMHKMGLTSMNDGKFCKAEKKLQETLDIKKRVWVEEHPETLATMSMLSGVYLYRGKYKEAEELGSQVLEIRNRVLGPGHRETLTSMNNLSLVYYNQGKYKEAEELGSQVLEIKKRVLGLEHPETLISMNNLASTYYNQGKHREAEELEVQGLKTKRRVLGFEHPETLLGMNNLAHTWKKRGYTEKAITLMEECIQLSEKTLGASHPRTKGSRRSLGVWLEEWQIQPSIDLQGQSHPESSISGGKKEEGGRERHADGERSVDLDSSDEEQHQRGVSDYDQNSELHVDPEAAGETHLGKRKRFLSEEGDYHLSHRRKDM